LLDGALAVMQRGGPEAVTFQSVATETGLAAPTLVQRFGSKQKLKRAALVRAWDLLDIETAKADRAAPPTPSGAIAMLVALSGDFDDGDDYAEGLLALREDFRDPALRRRGTKWGETLAVALGRRLGDRAGPRPDLGRLMAAVWQGTTLWWGFSRRGPLKKAVAAALTEWCGAIGEDTARRRR
jgi:AcrR family transcriptional regulator